jgi:hypothetical protein
MVFNLICTILSHKVSFMSISEPKSISKLRVNLSLLRSNMPLAVTEMELHLHTLLTLALSVCEWSFCTTYFIPLGHSPQYVLDRTQGVPQNWSRHLVESKSLLLKGSNFLDMQPVVLSL